MALLIRSIQSMDKQVSKVVVQGEPLSASGKMSVAEVVEYYKKMSDQDGKLTQDAL